MRSDPGPAQPGALPAPPSVAAASACREGLAMAGMIISIAGMVLGACIAVMD
jgi:hypothetical protein